MIFPLPLVHRSAEREGGLWERAFAMRVGV